MRRSGELNSRHTEGENVFEHDAHSLRFAYDDLTPFMERNHLLLLLGHAKKFRTIISHKRIKTTRKSSVAAIKMCNARISWNYASGEPPKPRLLVINQGMVL